MKKYYVVNLFFFCCTFLWKGTELHCQEIQFLQYNQTSALVNPALTGALSATRATAIYKDQWKSVTSPYRTYGASFEMRFKNSNQRQNVNYKVKTTKSSFKRMAAGVSFYSDKAGDGNMGVSQVNFTLSTFVPVTRKSSFSLGLQAGIVQRKIDFSKLIFPDQYNGAGYDAGISNGENPTSQNFTYPDFAGGINWNYGYSDTEKEENAALKANIGASIYHINEPTQVYLTRTIEKIYRKFITHADVLIGIKNTKLSVVPNYILTIQHGKTEMTEGIMLKYYFKKGPKYYGNATNSAIGFGISYRNKETAILSALIEYGQYAIGFSYNLHTTMLYDASKVRYGPEIFIRFAN